MLTGRLVGAFQAIPAQTERVPFPVHLRALDKFSAGEKSCLLVLGREAHERGGNKHQ